MEKKCCICGKIFIDYGNSAQPVKEGVCCSACHSRFVLPIRMFQAKIPENKPSYEIARNPEEFEDLLKRLKEKNFEQAGSSSSVVVFENIETEEKVIVCCV